jgi:hypothetical protein
MSNVNAPLNPSLPPKGAPYREWHIPFSHDQMTLREAHASLGALGAKQEDIPLRVQLVENPRFRLPGFTIFHGAVALQTHDYIHILLGRGLLPEDEAFVVGFTMGSTKRITAFEENCYVLASRYFYPRRYRFSKVQIGVFRNATRLARLSNCQPLDSVDFETYLDAKLREIRQAIGMESDLILAYYGAEKIRYPAFKGSQRLLV